MARPRTTHDEKVEEVESDLAEEKREIDEEVAEIQAIEEHGAEAILNDVEAPDKPEQQATEQNPDDEHGAERIYWEKVENAPTPEISGIDPASCALGPPEDVLLTVTGTGFDDTSQIAFGVDGNGNPKFETATKLVSDTELTIEITAGLFPNPDPNIQVLVGNVPPQGPRSDTATFSIGP